jgi:hypothetical protein
MAAVTVFTCTSVTGNGATATYTGSITSGASPLISGTPIIVAGFVAQPGFNGNFKITGGNLTTTFTAANATNASETHAATATYDPEANSLAPSTVATVQDPYGFIGYGYAVRELLPSDVVLGNFIPGTQGGTGQYIEV